MTPQRRRFVFAALLYVVCTGVFALVAGGARINQHTSFNHYALLADAWLHGRHDLAHGAPSYAQNNDFAEFEGKTFISFPPFPALLMLPFVKLAGSPENFRDGQFVVWLSGLGPALLFLVLDKLRRDGRSPRTERENLVLSLLFAFGTVYFFVAVEGTVWFAAHVVGVALGALFLLCALDARRPFWAGVLLACAWMTRPPMLLTGVIFAFEALRVHSVGGSPSCNRRLLRDAALFALPIAVAVAVASWMNHARFHDSSPFAMGHEHLGVVWKARMAKWGLFGTHYFPKNLGVMLTILPWFPAKGVLGDAPFRINEHGLALWFTTPLYFWLLWPRKSEPGASGRRDFRWLYAVFTLAAALPAVLDLMYQNSGWRQFGYRFSNDYALLLFVLLAIGARPMRIAFALAATWGLAWNLFGAVTFDRAQFDRFYFRDGSQTVLYQPD